MKRFAVLLIVFLIASFAMMQPAMASVQEQPSDSEQVMLMLPQMTDAQKAAMLDAAKHIQKGDSTVAQTKEWVDIGTSLGQALAGTAKEMNIAVNDFASSPVGKLAIGLILWKMLGTSIIHGIAALFCFILLFFWYRMYRNMFGEFDTESVNGKAKFTGFNLNKQTNSDVTMFGISFMGILLFIAGLVSILTA